MKRLVSILLVFILAIGLLSGCTSDVATEGEDIEETMDIAYYSMPGSPIFNWDPSVNFSNGTAVLHNVYETLLRFDPKTKQFEYVLAENYSVSEDGLTWTFGLRQGVKFHDGTDFNAEAVKFSIERTLEIAQGASYIWSSVDQINVIDEYTVEFKLMYPAPLDIIASCAYGAFIMAPSISDKPEDWFKDGNEMGTGPYMLESTNLGDEVILTKFDDYRLGWEGEHFEKIIFKKTPETSSRRQMLERGDADIINNMPTEDMEALKNNENVSVIIYPSSTNLFAFFNTEKSTLKDLRVRQALSYAFPYDSVIEHASGGYAEQSIGAIPKGQWGRGENLFQYSYNLDKAKELLNEVGIKEDELNLLLTYPTGDESQKKVAELYKAELSKIGIDLEIRAMPWESQWDLSMKEDPEDRQDIFLMYWWPDIFSPYSWLYGLFHSEESILFNLSYYKNEEFDSIIDEAYQISSVDINEAEQKFIEAQEILIEDSPSLFIYDRKDIWMVNSTFKGFDYNPAYAHIVFFYDCYREK